MALFQLMRSDANKPDAKVGRDGTNLKHLKRRLSKLHRGYIVELKPTGKVVRVVRGYSKQAQDALKVCGLEVMA